MSPGGEDPSLPPFSWAAWSGLDESSAPEILQAQVGMTDARAGAAQQPVQPDVSLRGRRTRLGPVPPSWGAKQSRHKGYFRHPGLCRALPAADKERDAQSGSKPTGRSDKRAGAKPQPAGRDAAATLVRTATHAEPATHAKNVAPSNRSESAPTNEIEARMWTALGPERTQIARLNSGINSQSGRDRSSSHAQKEQPRTCTALLPEPARDVRPGIRGGMKSSEGDKRTQPSKRRPQTLAVPLPDGWHSGRPRTGSGILRYRGARGSHFGGDRHFSPPPTTPPGSEHGTRGAKNTALLVKRPRPNRPADDEALIGTITTSEITQNVHTEARAGPFDPGRGMTRTHAAATLERKRDVTVQPQIAARPLLASQTAPLSLAMPAGPSRPRAAASALPTSGQAPLTLIVPAGPSQSRQTAPTRQSGAQAPSDLSMLDGPPRSGKEAILQVCSPNNPVQTGAEAASYRGGYFDVQGRRAGRIPHKWGEDHLLVSKKESNKKSVIAEIGKGRERLQELRKAYTQTLEMPLRHGQLPAHHLQVSRSTLCQIEVSIKEEQQLIQTWERMLEMIENDELAP